MDRSYYLDLAANGLSMPIAADLVLHEHADAESILLDGERLGMVLEETANRFCTPLAVPHMDLELEKKALLAMIGVPENEWATYHFSEPPTNELFERVIESFDDPMIPEMRAQVDAIKYISSRTDLLPIGMSVGPFSLMTKLVADPITPVCMAGVGMTAEEDEEIRLVEETLELGMQVILHNITAQVRAGARAIFIAEPAANIVYFSPNQLESGSDIFERYVMSFNRRIADLLRVDRVDLIFHCCGELTDYMVTRFASLNPAILSLGSSRKLWEDAALIPKTTVLYGNLPSKRFYSDDLITRQQVREMGSELIEKMTAVGHPFILGTECDVLSVRGCEETIAAKADTVGRCGNPLCVH